MWEGYREVVRKYRPIPMEAERALIALAQGGSRESRDELVLRQVGFVIFRLHKKVFYGSSAIAVNVLHAWHQMT